MAMLSAKEVGTMLGLSAGKVYDLAQRGILPCHRYSAKAIRFDQSDVEEYKLSCRSATTPVTSVGAISLTAKLQDPGSALAAYFLKAGVKAKPKSTTASSRRASTQLRLVSKSLTG